MRTLRLVLATLALLGACGRKGAPLAPELVRPNPAEMLAAIAMPAGVRLTWLRPLTYSGGQHMNDLGGFTIERAPGDGSPAAFLRVGTLAVEDEQRFRKERHMEWVDQSAVAGLRYLYRVTAYTLDGYQSAPAGPVAIRFGPGDKE
jgi:hypothetical protein